MYMASVDYYSTGLLDLALLARYLLYSCIRTGVQVLFSNNYFNQLPVWVKNLNRTRNVLLFRKYEVGSHAPHE